MAYLTEKLIMDTFEEMLRKQTLDKITVRALARQARVSPGSFYKHYQDIYDLVSKWSASHWREWWEELAGCPDRQTAEECLLDICRRYRQGRL